MKNKIIILSLFMLCLISVCVSAADFVTVNGTDFQINGKPFYFAGANNYYLFYKPLSNLVEVLDDAQNLGLTVIRTWGFCDGSYSYSFQTAPGVYSEARFQWFDRIIKEASDRNLKLIVPLVNNWDDFGGMCQYVKWCGLPDAAQCDADEPWPFERPTEVHDMFYTDICTKNLYKQYVAYFLNRVNTLTGVAYKDDPTIFAWELANEPRCRSDTTTATLNAWIGEMSAYVKSIDPNHLATPGGDGGYKDKLSDPTWSWWYHGNEGQDFIENHQWPDVDFATFRHYPEPGKFDDVDINLWIQQHVEDSHNLIGKPVVMEEFGSQSNKAADFTNYYSQLETRGANGDTFWLLADHLKPGDDGYFVSCPENAVCSVISVHADYMNDLSNSCNNDNDCNYLDNNYCNADLIKHDGGRCISNKCQVETTTIQDCNLNDNNYCDGTEIKYDDYTCSAASCILDSTITLQDCDDNLYCNGQETCSAATCQAGTPIDCSGNDLSSIQTCTNDPDLNPFTYDYFGGFTSACDEISDSCTAGSVDVTHTCDITQCSAECEVDADCDDSDPLTNGTCLGNCTCYYETIESCIVPYDNMSITTDTILCNGTYNLQDGLIINADNIILDCNHAELVGPRAAGDLGIKVYYVENVTIKNCNLKDFHTGMSLRNSKYNKFLNNRIYNYFRGLYAEGSDFDLFKNNTFYNLECNIFYMGSNSTFIGNTFHDSEYVFYIAGYNNLFYLNNFLDTLPQRSINGNNSFDNGSLGNYWSLNSGCIDLDYNGICDEPYNTTTNNGGNPKDMHPLVNYYYDQSCIEGWQPYFEACQPSDQQIIYYIDNNNCCSEYYLPWDNGTYVPCDYCVPDWQPYSTLCNDSQAVQYFLDDNDCYAQTGLESDLLGRPANQTYTCGTDCVVPYDGFQVLESTVLCKGNYTLLGGINITNSNLTLDCSGSTIRGDYNKTIGIEINNFDSVVVKNCIITNFSKGIHSENSRGITLENNTFYNSKPTIGQFTYAVFCENCTNSCISDNSVNCSGDCFGIYVNGINNLLDNNRVSGSRGSGINIHGFNATATNNYIAGNNVGITLYATHSLLANNHAYKNSDNNLWLQNSMNNTIINNLLEGNGGCGAVLLKYAYDNQFINNTIEKNWVIVKFDTDTRRNIFANNTIGIQQEDVLIGSDDIGNRFTHNHWLRFDEPSEGCYDYGQDGICDSSYKLKVYYGSVSIWDHSPRTYACTEDWQVQYDSCHTNDQQLKYYIDDNACGTTNYLPADNGTYVICNYCSEDIQGPFTTTCDVNDEQIHYYADNNYATCCAVTGLSSDCSIGIPAYANQTLTCDYCTPDWAELNTSCQPDDTITGWYNDTNNCYSQTGLASDNNPPANNTYPCDYCIPNLVNTLWSSWYDITGCQVNDTITQERNRTQYDNNYCGEVSNTTYYEHQTINCDYCTPDWQPYNTSCNGTHITEYYLDDNDCYSQTGLFSDLDGRPDNRSFPCPGIVCDSDDDCGSDGWISNNYCYADEVRRDYTTYACYNPGTTYSYCSNTTDFQLIEICEDDCADGQCITVFECYEDSDCGTNTWINSPYCQDGDIWQVHRIYTCYNPGTPSSYCNFAEQDELKESCSYGCFNGVCLNPPITCSDNSDCGTDGLIGNPYCSDGDSWQSYRAYTCNNAGAENAHCSYEDTAQLVEECGGNCIDGNCVSVNCSTDADCGADYWFGILYCNGNDIFQTHRAYTCNNPGTASSYCGYSDNDEIKESCSVNCLNGVCVDQYNETNSTSDLVALYFIVQTPNPTAGNPTVLAFNIENIGDDTLNDIGWDLYTGKGTIISGVVSELEAGRGIMIMRKATYSSDGSYGAKVVLDQDNKIPEFDEANNGLNLTINIGG
jgi:mannan endo-1,4-beta-mannosidase